MDVSAADTVLAKGRAVHVPECGNSNFRAQGSIGDIEVAVYTMTGASWEAESDVVVLLSLVVTLFI